MSDCSGRWYSENVSPPAPQLTNSVTGDRSGPEAASVTYANYGRLTETKKSESVGTRNKIFFSNFSKVTANLFISSPPGGTWSQFWFDLLEMVTWQLIRQSRAWPDGHCWSRDDLFHQSEFAVWKFLKIISIIKIKVKWFKEKPRVRKWKLFNSSF